MSQKDGLKKPYAGAQPGFKGLPVPGPNDLRPGMLDETPKYGKGRQALRYADGSDKIFNIGGQTDEGVATSPASARYTPGLRKSPREQAADPTDMTIQTGIKRQ